jgi:hypothetical protein
MLLDSSAVIDKLNLSQKLRLCLGSSHADARGAKGEALLFTSRNQLRLNTNSDIPERG